MTQPTDPGLADSFREAFRCHPAGVAILTADPGDGPVALTISSLISVSVAPPTVAFSLSARSSATEGLLRAETLVIHMAGHADLAVASLGATSGIDRFDAGVPWDRLPTGEPYFPGVGTWFLARRVQALPLSGATLVVAELVHGANARPNGPAADHALVYLDRRWHRLQGEAAS